MASTWALRLIDHPWLERLVRGRAWIAIVATALLGIVAMQVALLRLGAQIGGETAAVNSMQQRNAAVESAIGEAEASRGLGTSATSLGMVYPPAAAITYLQPNPGDAQRAVDTMTSPSAAALAAARAHPPRIVTPLNSAAKTGATAGAGTATGGAVAATSGTSTTAGTTSTTAGTTPTTTGTTPSTTATTPTTTATAATTGTSANGASNSTTTNTPSANTQTQPTNTTGAATTPAGGTTAPPATTGAGGAAVTGG